MPKLNKNKKKLLLCAIFIFALTVSSCKEKATAPIIKDPEPCLCPNDYENLWEQPLETIQNCVLGEWKIQALFYTPFWEPYVNAFVNITKDSVIITLEEHPGINISEYPPYSHKFTNLHTVGS